MKSMFRIFSVVVFVAAIMLSGCIFPYWDDGYDGGYRGGRHHDNGGHRGW